MSVPTTSSSVPLSPPGCVSRVQAVLTISSRDAASCLRSMPPNVAWALRRQTSRRATPGHRHHSAYSWMIMARSSNARRTLCVYQLPMLYDAYSHAYSAPTSAAVGSHCRICMPCSTTSKSRTLLLSAQTAGRCTLALLPHHHHLPPRHQFPYSRIPCRHTHNICHIWLDTRRLAHPSRASSLTTRRRALPRRQVNTKCRRRYSRPRVGSAWISGSRTLLILTIRLGLRRGMRFRSRFLSRLRSTRHHSCHLRRLR